MEEREERALGDEGLYFIVPQGEGGFTELGLNLFLNVVIFGFGRVGVRRDDW